MCNHGNDTTKQLAEEIRKQVESSQSSCENDDDCDDGTGEYAHSSSDIIYGMLTLAYNSVEKKLLCNGSFANKILSTHNTSSETRSCSRPNLDWITCDVKFELTQCRNTFTHAT